MAKSTVKTIRAEVSLTIPVEERYYKFTFSQERELQKGCDVKREVANLWKSSKDEINNQVKELCETLDYGYRKLL